jgi:hypothetical protein
MSRSQRTTPELYMTSPYGIPAYYPVAYASAPAEHSWSNLPSILFGMTLLFTSAAIIGLDIAHVVIEEQKSNETIRTGLDPDKVAAGIWTGLVLFIAALVILSIGTNV